MMDYIEEVKTETPLKKGKGSISYLLCASFNQDRVNQIPLLI